MFEVKFETFMKSWTRTYYSIDTALRAARYRPNCRHSVTVSRRGEVYFSRS
jgi:hypothetical protein